MTDREHVAGGGGMGGLLEEVTFQCQVELQWGPIFRKIWDRAFQIDWSTRGQKCFYYSAQHFHSWISIKTVVLNTEDIHSGLFIIMKTNRNGLKSKGKGFKESWQTCLVKYYTVMKNNCIGFDSGWKVYLTLSFQTITTKNPGKIYKITIRGL